MARRRGDARHVVHLREEEQIFVRVRFVHEQIIHAQVLEFEYAVFIAVCHQLFQLRVLRLFDAFQILDRAARHSVFFPLLLDGCFDRGNFFVQLSYLPLRGDGDLCKGTLRDDDTVPIAQSDFADKPLSVVLFQVLFCRHENVRVRVELAPFPRPLLHEVVRHRDHSLFAKSQLPHLHDGRYNRKSLARAYHMV